MIRSPPQMLLDATSDTDLYKAARDVEQYQALQNLGEILVISMQHEVQDKTNKYKLTQKGNQ